MAGAQDLVTTALPSAVVGIALIVIMGIVTGVPATDLPEGSYSSDCYSGNPGSDDGQGAMRGVHPVASSALRRAGVTEGKITQGLGTKVRQSSGTHGAIPGSRYGAAADISVTGMSNEAIKQLVHSLRMQGFVTWYREPGWNPSKSSGNAHIHAAYAGLPPANDVSAGQVQTYLNSETLRRNGLASGGGRNPNNFPADTFPTAEEIAAVRAVYNHNSSCVDSSSAAASPSEFVNWIGPLAAADDQATEVPGSITVAQAILESGWGKSTLATRGKNLFGIECSTRGVHAGCTPGHERFAAYASYEDSIRDHSRVLKLSHYAAAWPYRNDPIRFITMIAPIYAPPREGNNRNYVPMVTSLIRRYNLTQYDR